MAATENPGTEKFPAEGVKNRPSILLIIVGVLIFLLVVAIGGFVGYTQLPKVVANHADGGSGTPPPRKRPEVCKEKGCIIKLEPITTNLPADGSMIRIAIQLGLDAPKAELEKDSMDITIILDAIVSLIKTKTAEQINEAYNNGSLKDEIRMRVNEGLPKGKVVEVYITEFTTET